jgi:hypothetical protein
MYRVLKIEQDAEAAGFFGQSDKAAELFAKAVGTAWDLNAPGTVTVDLMIKAARALANIGRGDDAFDGVRTLTMTYIRTQQPILALRLVSCLPELHSIHPEMFPGAQSLKGFVEGLYQQRF